MIDSNDGQEDLHFGINYSLRQTNTSAKDHKSERLKGSFINDDLHDERDLCKRPVSQKFQD